MLTAGTQAKTAGFTLLSGLVWGINILTIIYNYTYVSNSMYIYLRNTILYIYLRNTWIIDRVGGFPFLYPVTPLRFKTVYDGKGAVQGV